MTRQIHYGKKFYKDHKTGYWISTTEPRIRAHVFVWEYYFGKPQKGFHVHHLDEDKSNNEISNLRLLEASEHQKLHWTEEKRKWAREHVDKIRHLTKAWHRSAEGRAWHILHGIETWKNRKPIDCTCSYCSTTFSTKTFHQEFCSNKCKSAARRKSGVDDIEEICVVCTLKFRKNKYGRQVTCGRACGGILKSKEYKRRGN